MLSREVTPVPDEMAKTLANPHPMLLCTCKTEADISRSTMEI